MRSGLDPPPNPFTALGTRQLDMELAPNAKISPSLKAALARTGRMTWSRAPDTPTASVGLAAAANRARLPQASVTPPQVDGVTAGQCRG
jgi:hypothetical protein